ncbi:type I-U CRISPR-associated RAMP protein Csb1/Cas7u [Accumulibacter sp.]|uniref:type I-G CRISPR-associated RAMP protein Csb1/Cas7g n=1 Tax=Accumulibacter sp. TaxID=2053492 RepID=UPI001AD57505|nr:type I-U CRISPR-associated RAMP protein Csb1/Cas7u [Accumulibacter sp.]MBN8514519.1 type I-U CRISPR-associated protein Cas7 [Accumulibacter sp.]MBO3702451.1 type I-U CRISPR-associated protein Cas7 [Accumulibacter sp.]
MPDLYNTIRAAVIDAAGISVNATLAAISGSRHVLPPTYADAPHKHNMTEPGADGIAAWVSIDSAASFANRMEDQLKRADLGLDPLRVHVAGRTLSTLEMPHRAYDAILRDSSLDGKSFRNSTVGQEVISACASDASAMLRYDPAVLLFGGWDSTGLGGNKGQERKWPAAVSVEIFGTNAAPINRAGGRLDPLGITLDAGRVIRDGASYRLIPEGEKTPPGAERPSEINHGNIAPTISPKGVLVEGIELSGALSLSRLRRYRFGATADDDVAARTLLALMGIYGIAAVIEDGLDLRRDCELVADNVVWAIRGTSRSETLAVSLANARQALEHALSIVKLADPVLFEADNNLEQLVARSR